MDRANNHFGAGEERSHGITRRSFLLGGCVGTASLLMTPLWSHGGLTAYAANASDPTFKVFVLSVEEIGISIVDVTGSSERPLPGTSVVLTSRIKPESPLTANSDEDGNVIFNIKDISETLDFGDSEKIPRFDGSVEIIPPSGYRRTVIKRFRCSGGSGFRVPTCLLTTDPNMYFRSMSFNDWDIQYFDNTAYRSITNTDTHELSGTIEAPGETSLTVKFTSHNADGSQEKTLKELNVSLEDGVGSFSVKSQFLYTGFGGIVLEPDKAFSFDVTTSKGTVRFNTRLSVKDTPIDLDAESSPTTIVPSLNSEDENALFTIPNIDSIPVPFKGSTISIWKPALPVLYNVSPAGIFVLGIGKNVSATRDMTAFSNKWTKETSQSITEQFKELEKKYTDSFDKYKSMRSGVDPNGNAVKKVDFSGKLSASFAFQVYGMFTFDWIDKIWNGSLNGIVEASLGAAFQWQTMIGPVPLFVILAPEMSLKFTLLCGTKTRSANPLDMTFDFSRAQIALTFSISIALTVGIGLASVASIGLRGSGYITMYAGFFEMKGYMEGYPLPRLIAGYGLSADVVVQALIFKWSGNIWSFNDDRCYDSWAARGLQSSEGSFKSALPEEPSELATGAPFGTDDARMYSHPSIIGDSGVNFQEFALNATIVSNDELLKSREMNGKKTVSGFTASAITFEPATLNEDGLYTAKMNVYENTDAILDEYEYEYVGEDCDAYCADPAGIEGLSADGSLIPTVDVRIARNVFSNPLQKIVLFHNTPILFRIISVSYEGNEARTRLAGQRYDKQSGKWENPVIIEVPMGTTASRMDTYDYDFDVVTNSDTRDYPAVRNGIHVILSSGMRPNGDQTSFLEASSNQLMSWIVLDEFLHTVSSRTWQDSEDQESGGYRALMTPRIAILPWKAKDGKTYVNCIVTAYLRRKANTAEDLYTEKADVTCDFAFLAGDTLYQGRHFDLNSMTTDMSLTAHAIEQTSTGAALLAFSVMSYSADGTRINSAVLQGDEHPGPESKMMLYDIYRNVPDTKDISNMQIWPGRSALLAVKDGVLHATYFELMKNDTPLQTAQVGPSAGGITSFRISQNGNVILYLQNQDGVGELVYDKNGESRPAKKASHKIMACICSGDVFSQPFALAEIKHAQDSILAADGGSDCYAFITSCITDMATSQADMYYTTVPVATGIDIQGFAAEYQFVTQGKEDQPFILTVKNVGNVILKGVKLQLCEAETGKVADERYVDFTKEALCASIWNPELYDDPDPELVELAQVYPETMMAANSTDANVLLDPANSNVLLPGQTGQYRALFSIPADWHGTVNVKLVPTEYRYDTVVTATNDPTADETPHAMAYLPADGFNLTAEVLVHDENDPTEQEVDDSQVWKLVNGEYVPVNVTEGAVDGAVPPEDATPTTPITETTVEKDGKTTKETATPMRLAASGDNAAWSLAGLAATAAAAGIVAYSARRAALESDPTGDDVDETPENGEESK